MHSFSSNVMDLNRMIVYCGGKPEQFYQQHPHGKSRNIHFAASFKTSHSSDQAPTESDHDYFDKLVS